MFLLTAHAKFPVTLPMVQKNVQGNRTHVTRYNSTLPALDIYTVVKSKNARLKRGLQTKKQHSLKKPHCGTEEMYIKFKGRMIMKLIITNILQDK